MSVPPGTALDSTGSRSLRRVSRSVDTGLERGFALLAAERQGAYAPPKATMMRAAVCPDASTLAASCDPQWVLSATLASSPENAESLVFCRARLTAEEMHGRR
jgi:hypothetical protein